MSCPIQDQHNKAVVPEVPGENEPFKETIGHRMKMKSLLFPVMSMKSKMKFFGPLKLKLR